MSKIRNIFRGKQKPVTLKPGTDKRQAAGKREVPDGLWDKCPQCKTMIFRKDLQRAHYVCSKCGYHLLVGARERLRQLVDNIERFEEFDAKLTVENPIGFPEYEAKKERDEKKTHENEAVITGKATINQHAVVLAVMEFGFISGSMGSAVGEKITRAFERAIAEGLPVVTVSSSGGARMQEGIISLMQMQKTAAAVERHSRAGLLYISVLVHPTTAGVYGSFASQGDIVIAEPGATVGFAGKAVIEAAVGRRIPPDLQQAETVFKNGFIDVMVHRSELRTTIGKLLQLHNTPVLPEAEINVPTEDEGNAEEPIAVEPTPVEAVQTEADPIAVTKPKKRSTRTSRSYLRRKQD